MNEGQHRTFQNGSKLSKLDSLIIPDKFPQDIGESQLKSIGIIGGNGQGTLRQDGSFAKKYEYELLRSEGRGNAVTGIRILGYATIHVSRSSIPLEVRRFYRGKPCVFMGFVSKGMEIDHKDGWSIQGNTNEDFQPACKAAQAAKRNYCNNICKPQGNRYDARGQGMEYNVGWIEGGPLRNQQIGCHGCYLYDPIAFRKALKIKN